MSGVISFFFCQLSNDKRDDLTPRSTSMKRMTGHGRHYHFARLHDFSRGPRSCIDLLTQEYGA